MDPVDHESFDSVSEHHGAAYIIPQKRSHAVFVKLRNALPNALIAVKRPPLLTRHVSRKALGVEQDLHPPNRLLVVEGADVPWPPVTSVWLPLSPAADSREARCVAPCCTMVDCAALGGKGGGGGAGGGAGGVGL